MCFDSEDGGRGRGGEEKKIERKKRGAREKMSNLLLIIKITEEPEDGTISGLVSSLVERFIEGRALREELRDGVLESLLTSEAGLSSYCLSHFFHH